VTTEKDNKLVDYLYGELSEEEAEAFERSLESDEALSSEVDGLSETLQTLRTVEAEDPSPHLDALILAHARQVADEEKEKRGWFRKLLASPLAGLVAAGSVAMIAALVAVPSMMLETSEEAPRAVEQIPSPAVVKESEAIEDEEELKPTDAPALDPPAAEPAPDRAAPKKKKRAIASRRPAPKPAKEEAPMTALERDELAGLDGVGDRSGLEETIEPIKPPVTVEAPPAPPPEPKVSAAAKAEPLAKTQTRPAEGRATVRRAGRARLEGEARRREEARLREGRVR
jgi:hypothetical protein